MSNDDIVRTSAEPLPLGGVVPILVTPFDSDGSVDDAELVAELDFLVDAGVGWVGFGFGSEVHRLDPDEVAALMAVATAHLARRPGPSQRRVGVVGNADMPSTRAGTASVRRVAAAGCDVAMVRPSGLAGAGQEELFEAFAQVAADGGLPIVVQDAPQNTGVQLSAGTLARLLREVPQVAAVKVEPTASAGKISAVVQALDGAAGTVLGGLGGTDLVHELERGSSGTMPGPALPEAFDALLRLVAAGRRAEAVRLWFRLLPLVVVGGRDFESFLTVQKHLLHRRGVLTGPPRLRGPHAAPDPRLLGEVDALWDLLDLPGLLGERA